MTPVDRDDPELTRKQQRARARAERVAKEAALRGAEVRRKRLRMLGGAGAVVVAVAAIVAVSVGGSTSPHRKVRRFPSTPSTPKLALSSLAALGHLRPAGVPGALGPEGVPVPNAPLLAGTDAMATGDSVDGVQCLGQEQVLFHVHAHLALFVDGAPRQIPFGIGIAGATGQNTPQGGFVSGGNCFYWLHTHAADGIIHIESPEQKTFTLGDFFDIWGQPLSPTQVGPAIGRVTAMYNGKRYTADPRDIPLQAHAQIQLEVGTPLIAPIAVTFAGGL